MTIRLVIADDHPVVLAGLKGIVEAEGEFEVVASVRDGAAALAALRQHHPDILVLDLRMPGRDGLAVLREMKRDRVATPVVVLTAVSSDDAVEAIGLGARGIVLKDMAAKLLVDALRRVHGGGMWIERDTGSRALQRLSGDERSALSSLTPRELEVARMTAQGLSNKAVADVLGIAEGTAKLHLHHVYEKLGVGGRVALLNLLRNT